MMVLLIVALLLANAFFVAFEFALVASRRVKLEQRISAGSRMAVRALAATQDLGEHIAGVQLGVTMASLGLGAVAEPTIGAAMERLVGHALPGHVGEVVGFVLALCIVVFLHTVFGEMVPKNLALARAESALVAMALPMRWFLVVFGPIIRVLDAVATAILKMLGVQKKDDLFTGGTAEEIARLLASSHAHGLIEGDQAELLAGAIAFGDRAVRDIMVARRDVVTVPIGATVADAAEMFRASGHSRLPVTNGAEELVGFVHAKDMISLAEHGAARPVTSAIRSLLSVPHDRHLDDVLLAMRTRRVHAADVTDEHGRTIGFVTLEDLLEELVGEIADETDQDVAF